MNLVLVFVDFITLSALGGWNVIRIRTSGRFEARIGIPGNKHIYLGNFTVDKEAARAYDAAVVRLKGAAATTNFQLSEYTRQVTEHQLKILEEHSPSVFFSLCCHAIVLAQQGHEHPPHGTGSISTGATWEGGFRQPEPRSPAASAPAAHGAIADQTALAEAGTVAVFGEQAAGGSGRSQQSDAPAGAPARTPGSANVDVEANAQAVKSHQAHQGASLTTEVLKRVLGGMPAESPWKLPRLPTLEELQVPEKEPKICVYPLLRRAVLVQRTE